MVFAAVKVVSKTMTEFEQSLKQQGFSTMRKQQQDATFVTWSSSLIVELPSLKPVPKRRGAYTVRNDEHCFLRFLR